MTGGVGDRTELYVSSEVLIMMRHKTLLIAKVTLLMTLSDHSTFVACVTCTVRGLLRVVQGTGRSFSIEWVLKEQQEATQPRNPACPTCTSAHMPPEDQEQTLPLTPGWP